jgi:hypothetical protein
VGLRWTHIDEVCGDLGPVPTKADKRVSRRLNALKLLHGEWLEVDVARRLMELRDERGSALFDEVAQDVVYGNEDDNFQADVVAVRGYRAYLFSCTTDVTKALCKSKLFEGLERTTRVGGDQARVALVCMSASPIEVLRQARSDGLDHYDQVRVFGAAHLRGESAPCSADEVPRTFEDAMNSWVQER